MMQNLVREILQQIPEWKDLEDVQAEPLKGLTNSNFLLTVQGERFVLRVAGENGDRLNINRQAEQEILSLVAEAGIGAEVLHYLLPQGHLVTRYIDGRHLSLADYRQAENLRRIVETLKRLHALPPVAARFSPFRRVEHYARQARSLGVAMPEDLEGMLATMKAIEGDQARDPGPWRRLCHNDLFCVNVLDDGGIRFIDWEFAGVNDIYYDLATLTYAYDSPDTLSREEQELVLHSYFGEVRDQHWRRLHGMRLVLMFFTGMWGLLQQGLLEQGLVRAVEGFDYREYAENTFEMMRKIRG